MGTVRIRTLAVAAAAAATAITMAVLPAAGSGAPPLDSGTLNQLSTGPRQPVIVLLRDQPSPGQHGGESPQAEQAPLVDQVRQTGATHITQFSVVNGFAATVTAAERSKLAGNTEVSAVVPDLPIREAPIPKQPTAVDTQAQPGTPKLAPNVCPADPAKPLLEPEALQSTHAAFADRTTPQAQSLATGKGTSVAFLADGIDTANPDFVRPDGSKVFSDYRDFTGEGTSEPADGQEAFGDASSIAAQGKQTYDLSQFVNPANPLPAHCSAQVRGMAPDSALVGLKVIASNGFGSTSAVVQAIDYAVNHDHVNVINESLGANPYPDSNSDPFTLANRAAVAAGVTVVTSAGDAGYGNTVDSPASDPSVISVGASTTYEVMAQTRDSLPGFSGGWSNDNVSAVSSSGIAENGHVDDLLAPGDENWALCTANAAQYTGCKNYRGQPSNIQVFGGTSEAAPLVAGAAALVIQAYSQTHGNSKPTPAMVKQILTSTATDQNDPSDRQGAGVLNALAAVQAAMSIQDGAGKPAAQGNGLLFGSDQLQATDKPGTPESFTLPVTNVGSASQTVSAHGRALTTVLGDQRGSVVLNTSAAGPSFVGPSGTTDNYVKTTFTVPAKADHLDASIAWTSPGSNAITMILLDPKGDFAGYSMPQSPVGPDFGHVDVHAPDPGTWTALVYSPKVDNGFAGPVSYEFKTSGYAGFGAVTGGPLTLRPGESGLLHVAASTPATPGDQAAAVELDTNGGQRFAVPLVLRSLVSDDGAFSGTLTGGNGRSGGPAQQNTYQFDVPAGQKDIGVHVTLDGDVNQYVMGYLVSPDGQILSQSSTVQSVDANGFPTAYSASLQSYARNPRPGRWAFVVAVANAVSGSTTSEKFTGQVKYNTVQVSSDPLPSGNTVLPAGSKNTVAVKVHNTAAAPESYFVDARNPGISNQQLIPADSAANVELSPSASTSYVVPTETGGLIGVTSGSVPVSADMYDNTGEPEVLGPPGPGNIAVAFLGSPQVGPGRWGLEADEIGPAETSSTGTANLALVAVTKPFDTAVTSSTGDQWLGSVQAQAPKFTPLRLDPGADGTITVTITPQGQPGTVVDGTLYVDDTSVANGAGDELIALPYHYTIG